MKEKNNNRKKNEARQQHSMIQADKRNFINFIPLVVPRDSDERNETSKSLVFF